ncbi:MAG: hypothetical protein K2H30_06445 [Clostridia bacterium]|nr:hypothetical protein [Clostridia bacterium]
MKSLTKTSKAVALTLTSAVAGIAMAVALTACNPADTEPENLEPGTYKYSATLDAGIPMGNPEPENLGGVLSSTYVTYDEDDNYTLTLIFAAKQIEINGIKATMFVGEGTIGAYDSNGELITEGVEVGYSKSYVLNSDRTYVGYVTSVVIPVEKLSETYDLALYINSDVMGYQFTNTSAHKAQIKLDLESGEVVESISGLGSATLLASPKTVETMTFTVNELKDEYNLAVYVNAFNATALSGMQFPYTSSSKVVSDAVLKITADEENEGEYTATLDAVINMGQSVNFTENLLKGIKVTEVSGGYEITLTFGIGTVKMPGNNVMTGYMNAAASKDYFNNDVVPAYGYYDGETLVTEGVVLTYNTDNE